MNSNFTKEQAIELAKSKWWIGLDPEKIVRFQLFEEKLCMHFSDFHEALEKALGRSVWTHELAFIDQIQKEFLGEKKAPTFQEILNLIPEDKQILLSLIGVQK